MSTEADPDAFVAIEAVDFGYGDEAIVDGVDWAIPRGAFHCLVGRSGSGKTTLLKLAAGLLAPSQGVVRIDGVALDGPGPRRQEVRRHRADALACPALACGTLGRGGAGAVRRAAGVPSRLRPGRG